MGYFEPYFLYFLSFGRIYLPNGKIVKAINSDFLAMFLILLSWTYFYVSN